MLTGPDLGLTTIRSPGLPCNGRPRDPCNYMDHYSFIDPWGMEGWVGIVCMQSAAWLIFNLRRSDHVSDALISFHWTHQVQGFRTRIQNPARLCTVVPWPVYLRCRPSKSPRTSLFLQRLHRPTSGSPFHCWEPSVFGCWPSGVELPATGGYVGTVTGDLPHSTRDVSVHWVIFWHLTHPTYSLHAVYSGPSSVRPL